MIKRRRFYPLRNGAARASGETKKGLSLKHIVILGDSVAYGYGTRGGIAIYLKETFPDSNITNLGINGLTSSGLIDRLDSSKWNHHISNADLVLLNIGGNDLLRGFHGAGAKGLVRQFTGIRRSYRANLLAIYRHIRGLNNEVLIVQNDLYNSMKKEVQYFGFTGIMLRIWNKAIGEEGVIISKTQPMGKNAAIWLDDIHPNDEGYKIMHELLMKTLAGTGYDILEPEELQQLN